jgi:hypothetical protein
MIIEPDRHQENLSWSKHHQWPRNIPDGTPIDYNTLAVFSMAATVLDNETNAHFEFMLQKVTAHET